MLDVNLRAPVVLARLLAETMVARRSGHLVFVNSLSGKSAGPRSSLYSATKYGLRGFSLALRQDLEAHGVGVSCVFPGFVRDAGMFASSGASLPPGVGTVTPEAVAAANREGDRAEPRGDRRRPARAPARRAVAGVAPGLSASVQRGSAATASRATSPTASASGAERMALTEPRPRAPRAGAGRDACARARCSPCSPAPRSRSRRT